MNRPRRLLLLCLLSWQVLPACADQAAQPAGGPAPVVFSREGLEIQGGEFQVRSGRNGLRLVTMLAPADGRVRFRIDLKGAPRRRIEGEAVRADYDEGSEVLRLSGHARMVRFEEARKLDELHAERIVIDQRARDVRAEQSGAGGRGVRVVIQPPRPPAVTQGALSR